MNEQVSVPPRPFDARMIDVGDGHWIYVEEVGRRGGRPCLFLHGGPGSGAQHLHRNLFDPERDHAFLIDQRGAGRSHPYLSCRANTTAHLVGDIEAIREHFRIDRWLIVGGSWGSTLALAYAQAHPDRVSGMVLRAIFLGTRQEVVWAFIEGPRAFRPQLYASFLDWLPASERADPLAAYVRRLRDPDPSVHTPAAHIWNAYERILSELTPQRTVLPADCPPGAPPPPTPIVEAHYIAHDFFLAPGQLLAGAQRLAGIPGAIVQGRYDLLCPPAAATAIAAAWTDCKLQIIEAAGHAMSERGVTEAMRQAIAALD
ncbi:MAG TPA: prolyl aminopeptidase [Hyphomicrobium sp.]|nr:prolyl aminopeptidase [Hyphomicrobium sp.]